MEAEIGSAPLAHETVEHVEKSLKTAPPIPFDVARQVRVFQPYIQYVDVHLSGCAIQRQRVAIPRSIQRLGASSEIEDRLRTTFDLVERSSSISSQALDTELRSILTDFTRSLGKPWGRVMLRTPRGRFEKRIQEFRDRIEAHKKNVEKELSEHLARSLNNVLDYYLPFVKEHPPDELVGQTLFTGLSDADIRKWLLDQLERVFPEPDSILSEMKLEVQYRDVTYETVSDERFFDALKKAYPYVDWEKPFHEFSAAKEKAAEGKMLT